jgi:hypothetical protein
MLDPSADNTDVYAFTAKDAPGSLTVVANWVPLEEPAGGPYFGKLDPRARYYVKIDNTGDGREDVAYRWKFHNKFRNPNSFLYAAPTVTSVNDPDINFVQTYDLYREEYNKDGDRKSSKLIADNVPVAPDNVGPKTIPNYEPVWLGAIAPVRGGGKTFVGPADDPFFVDLGAVFDGINIDKPGRPNIGLGNQGGGKDDVSSYNTHSFVLQVPESQSACGPPPSASASRCAGTTAGITSSATGCRSRGWATRSSTRSSSRSARRTSSTARPPRTIWPTSARTPSTRSRLAS